MSPTSGAPWRSALFEPASIDEQAPAARVLTYALLILWSLVVLVPLYWVLITSFKGPAEVDNGPFYIPFVDFTPNARRLALHAVREQLPRPLPELGGRGARQHRPRGADRLARRLRPGPHPLPRQARRRRDLPAAADRGRSSRSSPSGVPWPLALAVGVALFGLALGTLGRRTRRALGNNDIEFWIISNRIMPPIVAVLPIYVMFQQLHLLDTRTALIATYTAVNLPIVVWLTRDFFAGIPIDLEESAELDGASKFRVFFTIALPLVRSGLVATFLLVLILAWNEYLLALFLSNANAQTMPVLVSAQNTTRGPQWWNMSVLIVVMIAPVVVIASVLQKHIARGLLVGAVKG